MKPERNRPCPCGSGKKFKHCCESKSVPYRASPPAEVITLPDGRAVSIAVAIQAGIEHHQAGRLRKAQAIYDSILRTQPNNPDALHLLGMVARQTGNLQVALALIGKAITLNPDAALFHNNLGEALRTLNRHDEAIAESQRALELQPDFPEAHCNLGMALRVAGRPDEAVTHFQRAIKYRPRFIEAYLGLSETLVKLHRGDEALSCLRQASTFSPSDRGLACAMGITLRALGRIDEAIAHYVRAISEHPDAPELHHNLGFTYQTQGDLMHAAECYRRELELCPNDQVVRHMLNAVERINSDRAPAEYVRMTFDHYSNIFDEHLVKKLEYHIPELIGKAIRDIGRRDLDSVDLGCGTGLMGPELRDISKSLAGVDLSPKMIEMARARSVYDRLVAGDLQEFLETLDPSSIDLAVATDVFVYIGRLDEIFTQCARVLRRHGVFAFSLEALVAGDFALQTTGRYAHSPEYVTALCQRSGFQVLQHADVDIRKNLDQPVPGHMFILVKTGERPENFASSAHVS